jgi:hypothetical protein
MVTLFLCLIILVLTENFDFKLLLRYNHLSSGGDLHERETSEKIKQGRKNRF